MLPFVVLLALVISAACSNSTADATNKSTAHPATRGTVSERDHAFIQNAVVSGKRAIEHARIAEAGASRDEVKAFAAQLVLAHMAANDELNAWLQQKQLRVSDNDSFEGSDHPGSVGAKNDATVLTRAGRRATGSPSPTGTSGSTGTVATTGEALDRERSGETYPWMHASGAQFDAGFLADQIKLHQDAIALFDQESIDSVDPELRAFAAKYLPVLRDQLRRAEGLHRSRPREQ